MSGYSDPDTEGRLEQPVVFLEKPFSPRALLRIVREALERD
jgi:hypothetical protein